jgi:hypothetical protein
MWKQLYTYIYSTNSIIANLEASSAIPANYKPAMEGEVRFLRALNYFYLVNLYDSVPLTTTPDYTINSRLSRVGVNQVYDTIVSDLLHASVDLGINFTTAGNRIRASKWAATALLARVYLYQQNWVQAEAQASAVIGSGLYTLDSLNNVFLYTSKEAILQLESLGGNLYSFDGYLFDANATNVPLFQLSTTLLKAFESGDARKTHWAKSTVLGGTTYYFPYKYKLNSGSGTATTPTTEPTMELRLGEQYLIRAEARAQQGNTTGAAADLNLIRKRAGLPATTASSQADLLMAIYHERQVELFTELGHRWFDVKRTGQADAVFGAEKAGWVSTDAWYPIPFQDIQVDVNLTQNSGY